MLLIVWIVAAQLGMRMTMTDDDALQKFRKAGIELRYRTTSIEGSPIHYVTTGPDDAPTLFFVHGSPGSWTAFEDYLKDTDLCRHYRLISIDRPGFGYSNFGQPMDMPHQANLVGTLITQIKNGKKIYVIGHSLGGPLAVMLAADKRNAVSGLVLLAGSVDPSQEEPEKWRPWLAAFPLRLLVPRIMRTSNAELMDFKKDVLLMPAALQDVTCPVLIIQGLKDDLVPPANAFYAQKQMIHAPTIKLVTIADANHFIPWTRYELIKKNILSFTK